MDFEKSKYSSTLFEKHIARPIMEGSPKQFKPKNAIRKFCSQVLHRVLCSTPCLAANAYMKLKDFFYGFKSEKPDYDESVNLEGGTYETV